MLITRAVSLEFRSKVEGPGWRKLWDGAFSVSSTVAALLFGVALGNVLRGIPLDVDGNYTGTFFGLLNPYALLIGLLGLAMIAFHGANFAVIKTDGALHDRARGWSRIAGIAYLVLFLAAVGATLGTQPHLLENYSALPVLWVIPVVALAAIVAGLLFGRRGQPGRAFLASAVSVAAQFGLVGSGLFPRLVPALNDPALTLTAANSSSSEKTLGVMLVLALVGMPIVLGYTIWAYRAFKGKVNIADESNHY
jgi:cytochrome d ubiquinol oxidase subunit II